MTYLEINLQPNKFMGQLTPSPPATTPLMFCAWPWSLTYGCRFLRCSPSQCEPHPEVWEKWVEGKLEPRLRNNLDQRRHQASVETNESLLHHNLPRCIKHRVIDLHNTPCWHKQHLGPVMQMNALSPSAVSWRDWMLLRFSGHNPIMRRETTT